MTTGRTIKAKVGQADITAEELAEETGRPLVWAERVLAAKRRADRPKRPKRKKL